LSKSDLKLVYHVNIVYGNLKSENSQDYAQKPQRKFYVHEFGFCNLSYLLTIPRSPQSNKVSIHLPLPSFPESSYMKEKTFSGGKVNKVSLFLPLFYCPALFY
jgi:hypothetical protein